MIQVPFEVNRAILKDSRTFDARIVIDDEVQELDVMSLKYYRGACDEFSIGALYVPYSEIEVYGQVRIDEPFYLQMSVMVSSEFTQYFNVGRYRATTHEQELTKTKIYAQGRIQDMQYDILFTEEPESRTVLSIYQTLLNKGYEIRLINEPIIPDVDIRGDASYLPLKGITCKQALEIIAQCTGCYITEDYDGNIVIGKYGATEDTARNVTKSQMTEEPILAEDYELTGIKVTAESIQITEETDDPEKKFIIGDSTNVVAEVSAKYFTEEMIEAYTLNTIGFTFLRHEMSVALGDFRLEPWDCILYKEGIDALMPKGKLVPRNILLPGNVRRPNTPELDESLIPSNTLVPTNGAPNNYFVQCLNLSFIFDGGLMMEIKSQGEYIDKQQEEDVTPPNNLLMSNNLRKSNNPDIMEIVRNQQEQIELLKAKLENLQKGE